MEVLCESYQIYIPQLEERVSRFHTFIISPSTPEENALSQWRTITLRKGSREGKPVGIQIVQRKDTGGFLTHAYKFDSSRFSLTKAKEWLNSKNVKWKEVEKATVEDFIPQYQEEEYLFEDYKVLLSESTIPGNVWDLLRSAARREARNIPQEINKSELARMVKDNFAELVSLTNASEKEGITITHDDKMRALGILADAALVPEDHKKVLMESKLEESLDPATFVSACKILWLAIKLSWTTFWKELIPKSLGVGGKVIYLSSPAQQLAFYLANLLVLLVGSYLITMVLYHSWSGLSSLITRTYNWFFLHKKDAGAVPGAIHLHRNFKEGEVYKFSSDSLSYPPTDRKLKKPGIIKKEIAWRNAGFVSISLFGKPPYFLLVTPLSGELKHESRIVPLSSIEFIQDIAGNSLYEE